MANDATAKLIRKSGLTPNDQLGSGMAQMESHRTSLNQNFQCLYVHNQVPTLGCRSGSNSVNSVHHFADSWPKGSSMGREEGMITYIHDVISLGSLAGFTCTWVVGIEQIS